MCSDELRVEFLRDFLLNVDEFSQSLLFDVFGYVVFHGTCGDGERAFGVGEEEGEGVSIVDESAFC